MTTCMGVGGVQPVKVSITWVGRLSSSVATCLMGTVTCQLMFCCSQKTFLPSLKVFSPRPVGFAGRWMTSMLSMRPGTCRFASATARSDAMLKASEPQKRIRNGSDVRAGAEVELHRQGGVAIKERTGLRSLQIMVQR